MEQTASTINMPKIKDFLKKYNFYIVCFLCLVFSVCSIWVKPYFLIAYVVVLAISSLFYDVNKIIIQCSFFIFFGRCFNYFHGIILLCAALFVVLIRDLILKRVKLSKDLIFPTTILLVYVALFFSVKFNPSRFEAIYNTIFPIIIAIELFAMRKNINLMKIFKGFSIVLIVACCVAFLSYYIGNYYFVYHIDSKGVYRFMAFLSHENALSIWCAGLLSIVLVLFLKKKLGLFSFTGLAFGLSLFGILTKSKAFLLIFVLLVLVFLVANYIKNWKIGLIETVLMVAVFGIIFAIFPNKIIEYIHRFFAYSSDGGLLNMLTTGRVIIWEHYFNVWIETPLTVIFGHGGTYITDWILGSHNTVLEVLVYYGVLGLILDAALIVYFMVVLSKNRKNNFFSYVPFLTVGLLAMIEVLNKERAILIVFACFVVSFGKIVSDEISVVDKNAVGTIVEKDLISVIVPVYNVENYIRKCIESILNQTYKNLEIILVDDGSPDNCGKICDEYAKIDSRVKVIHKQNGGVSSARNAGLEIAKGDYVAFVDGDDFIEQDMYEKMHLSLKKDNADISFCRFNEVVDAENFLVVETALEDFCASLNLKYVFNQTSLISVEDNCKKVKKYVGGYIWRSLFNRNLIGKTRFDENVWHAEDLLFLIECLCKKEIRISFVDEYLYNYVIRSGSQTHNEKSEDKKYGEKLVKNRLDYMKKIENILKGTRFEKCVDGMYFYGYSTIFVNKYVNGVDIDLKELEKWNTQEKYQENKKYVYGLKFRLRNYLIHKNNIKMFKLLRKISK